VIGRVLIDLPLSKSARAEVGQKTGGFFRPSLKKAAAYFAKESG